MPPQTAAIRFYNCSKRSDAGIRILNNPSDHEYMLITPPFHLLMTGGGEDWNGQGCPPPPCPRHGWQAEKLPENDLGCMAGPAIHTLQPQRERERERE